MSSEIAQRWVEVEGTWHKVLRSIFELDDAVEITEEYIKEYGYVVMCPCGTGVVLSNRENRQYGRQGTLKVVLSGQTCYAGTCKDCHKLYRTLIKRYEADPLGRLQLVDDGDNGSESEDDDDAATSEVGGVAGGVAFAS